MFSKKLSGFFRASNSVKSMQPKEWLDAQFKASALDKQFPKVLRERTQNSAKVYYNEHYFAHNDTDAPFSLRRALSKTTAVSVAGDRTGIFQNGTPFPASSDYFARIPLTHPELLSPVERLSGAKKIIFSNSSVLASGGYPAMNPRVMKKKPHDVGIFSLAGACFENLYLHYSLFMLDPINSKIDSPMFAHLFEKVPTDFKDAQSSLGPYDSNGTLTRIRTGLPLLARSASNMFYPSFTKKNAVLFLSEAYFRYQLEDISMLLTAVNDAAQKAGKPALLKATAVGMGFFAKINEQYDIQHLLYPHYLRAFQKLLQKHSYPWIAKVEFPTFNEQLQQQFDAIMDTPIEKVEVYQRSRDVLEFTEEEIENYFVCAINPADAFSYTGNEWGFGSVEAMIGLNSSLRMDQIPLENPLLLDSNHHIPVRINSAFEAELLDSKANNLHL
ncbi:MULTISPECIES: type IV secretion protein Dot [Legionella]|uniref:type IV secretion protein Dot n=1 Tax=Legionella TaxID=445 RepID=UPI00095B5BDC|nr:MULTISPECIES: type IV secretion protein Dot [Legionella]MBN9226533.1 type IV secretion protein Dot [Legionella steelei]OJW15545.1 MAG: type IV secretion protein Dot [Legionella sp. 39-23]